MMHFHQLPGPMVSDRPVQLQIDKGYEGCLTMACVIHYIYSVRSNDYFQMSQQRTC